MMNKIYQWFVQSSANPEAVSLSAQSLLLGYIPIILTVAGFFPSLHTIFTADSLTAVVHSIVSIIDGVLMLVAAVGFVYGFCRKVWLTLFA